MKQSNSLSKQVVCLLVLLCAFACVASADTIYNVSGSFSPSTSSNPFTGPLNGGTFNGTFTATLPTTSGVGITSFNINLIDSSGKILATLSNSVSGDAAGIHVITTDDCATGSGTAGPCDLFEFTNSSFTDFLYLATPLGFTGGSVYPGADTAPYPSWAAVGGSDAGSLVASGSIEPVRTATPEPASLLLFGAGLLGLAILARGRIERRRPLEY